MCHLSGEVTLTMVDDWGNRAVTLFAPAKGDRADHEIGEMEKREPSSLEWSFSHPSFPPRTFDILIALRDTISASR